MQFLCCETVLEFMHSNSFNCTSIHTIFPWRYQIILGVCIGKSRYNNDRGSIEDNG